MYKIKDVYHVVHVHVYDYKTILSPESALDNNHSTPCYTQSSSENQNSLSSSAVVEADQSLSLELTVPAYSVLSSVDSARRLG